VAQEAGRVFADLKRAVARAAFVSMPGGASARALRALCRKRHILGEQGTAGETGQFVV
jgi:hypothetical protein